MFARCGVAHRQQCTILCLVGSKVPLWVMNALVRPVKTTVISHPQTDVSTSRVRSPPDSRRPRPGSLTGKECQQRTQEFVGRSLSWPRLNHQCLIPHMPKQFGPARPSACYEAWVLRRPQRKPITPNPCVSLAGFRNDLYPLSTVSVGVLGFDFNLATCFEIFEPADYVGLLVLRAVQPDIRCLRDCH